MKVGAVGGYQLKVLLTDEAGSLKLDGAERLGDSWRPVAVQVPDDLATAFNKRMSAMTPTPSALQVLLKSKLGET